MAYSQAADITGLAVQVKATVNLQPPEVLLSWPSDPQATGISVFRKTKEVSFWGAPIVSLAGSDSMWTYQNVLAGETWEYKLHKTGSNYTGYGYIHVGLHSPAIEQKGKVVLVIDTTHLAQLSTEIDRLEDDMIGEGWLISRLLVAPADSVPDIRAAIQNIYQSDPSTRAVVLLGHVPVPYSGNINPDGHSNHVGAWPADGYYGDMNGNWTDVNVNNTSASRAANHNTPGDGKFDQSTFPGDLELEVGRIDMHDMPAFAKSEVELLRQYLDRNHAFRHKHFDSERRGLVDNHFGYPGYSEGFAANAYRNFGPMFGADKISATDYFTSMNSGSYLWSYGCGGGSYKSAGGIGNTSNFANDSLQGVFTMLIGSYFGDWDNTDNFLRAPLASSGTILTNAWAGRPFWYFHHMALGENIGYSARLSQNNSNIYHASFGARYVHMGLLGDPTLKMHIVAPPSNLSVVGINHSIHSQLTWDSSPDSVLGYYVFRKNDSSGYYFRISEQIVTGTSYIDSTPAIGQNEYMVSAVKLENESSGKYLNLSYGIRGENVITYAQALKAQIPGIHIFPLPANRVLNVKLPCVDCGASAVQLLDMSGRLVAMNDYPAGSSYLQVPVSQLPAGSYVLRYMSESQTAQLLFVVQH